VLKNDRGSSLMLWPAAILIVLLLASIAFDFSLILLGRRELRWAAESAANDAATFGIDQAVFRETNVIRFDRARLEEAVARSVHARDLRFELVGDPRVDVFPGTDEVRVTISGRVPYLFADAFPGLPDSEVVTVIARAHPVPSSP
jgi:Putative Flp pilus-assembly TadE/G-like